MRFEGDRSKRGSREISWKTVLCIVQVRDEGGLIRVIEMKEVENLG